MTLKEGMLVYACLNNVPRQCKIIALDFGQAGNHLLLTLPDQQHYIVSEDELADNPDDCYANHMAVVEREYKLYHDATNSSDALILHLLQAAIDGRKLVGIERQAIIDRASQYTQIDVDEYLSEVANTERDSRKKNEVKEST